MNSADRMLQARRKAELRGRRSETIATILLIAKGYRILARRMRNPAGEIDLVALAPFGPVCFIEVKARAVERDAVESVGFQQRGRIARAANLYLAQRPALAGRGSRFDVITVAKGSRPRHYRAAWRSGDNS